LVLNTYTVTNTNDSGSGSLRQAILDANGHAGLDTIAFNIGGGGVQTIQPTSALPSITDPVIIDGTTQPGFAGTPIIALSGGDAGTGASGLMISGGDSTVRGLVVNGFSEAAVLFETNGENVVEGNYLGTDVAGTMAVANNYGVETTSGANNNRIGGTEPGKRNLISGNKGYGVELLSSGNVVQGNYIGTDVTGTMAVSNGMGGAGGMFLGVANDNTIGGTASGAGNLISGNYGYGILVNTSGGHVIAGNLIGTDVTGTKALGNNYGIFLGGGTSIVIGGAAPGAGNVVSGNYTYGIGISGAFNLVQGNRVGTDITGMKALGNDFPGILIEGSSNTIGGTSAGAGNLVSGNKDDGIDLTAGGNLVQGNFIGTDVTGKAALANQGNGIRIINAASNTIGGTVFGAANLISGNTLDGVNIVNLLAKSNLVQGNLIGTDVTGNFALGNQSGVSVGSQATDNTIGGTAAGAHNVISGNRQKGVMLASDGNRVQGNFIGTDVVGQHALGNGAYGTGGQGSGVALLTSSNNTVGGTVVGARNVIGGNTGDGVYIENGSGNSVAGNYLGLDITGVFALGNRLGVDIFNSSGNTIGGTFVTARNVISASLMDGVAIRGNDNVIQGNFIGTNAAGSGALGNVEGVSLYTGTNNQIGGTASGARNVISGNSYYAVDPVGASGTLIQGNYIGTDAAGTAAVGNRTGVYLENDTNLGGTVPGAGNLVSGNTETGVDVLGKQNRVEGNLIGTDVTGTKPIRNQYGVVVTLYSSGAVIGGTQPGAGNLISGNETGISVGASGTLIQGNRIGTDISGTKAVGNVVGVGLGATSIIVGGTAAGAGNLISGNTYLGVDIENRFNVLQGNYVGTDAAGTMALANNDGVRIFSTSDNTIGGTAPGARNVISGNTYSGIVLDISSYSFTGNVIEGNFIGTNAAGSAAVGNGRYGVYIDTIGPGSSTQIGGTDPGAGNVISGNVMDGLRLIGGGGTVLVQGNLIGTDVSGTKALGNGTGVTAGSEVTIGGVVPGARNVISGNIGSGLEGAAHSLIQGNFIGTDITGKLALGNATGVRGGGISVIGGTAAGAGNLISGNIGDGLDLVGTANIAQGNLIGTDVTGTLALGNGKDGLTVADSGNTLGGTIAAAANTIAFNGHDGILVDGGKGNGIRRNLIAGHLMGLGIELTHGGNNNQAFPVLTSAMSDGMSTVISGQLVSKPSTTFTIEFFADTICNPSGYGEGEHFLDSTTVTTDADGNASFTFVVAIGVDPGQFISATATDPGNNTSAFAACVEVTAPVTGIVIHAGLVGAESVVSSLAASLADIVVAPTLAVQGELDLGNAPPLPGVDEAGNHLALAGQAFQDFVRQPAGPGLFLQDVIVVWLQSADSAF
jgi:hypothetical protein